MRGRSDAWTIEIVQASAIPLHQIALLRVALVHRWYDKSLKSHGFAKGYSTPLIS
jgi:hypothetical protein